MNNREAMFQRTLGLREGAAQARANSATAKSARKEEHQEIEAGEGILANAPSTKAERETYKLAAQAIAHSRSAAAELARAVLEDGQLTAQEMRRLANEVRKLRAAKKLDADKKDAP